MKEWIAVAVLLYSVPLFALLLTWKKPLWQALRGIVLSEVLGILCFFPLYALVGMLSWQWFRWGGVSLQEILSFWKGGGLALAAQVLQPQDLEAYVLAQIHGALSGESL